MLGNYCGNEFDSGSTMTIGWLRQLDNRGSNKEGGEVKEGEEEKGEEDRRGEWRGGGGEK